MKLARSLIEFLIYGLSGTASEGGDDLDEGPRRFTQDSPVLPDVWVRFGEEPDKPQQLLLTPRFGSTAGNVSKLVRQGVKKVRKKRVSPDVAYNQTYVAADLYFDEVVRVVLPMTRWWQENVRSAVDAMEKEKAPWRDRVEQALVDYASKGIVQHGVSRDLLWMIRIVGSIGWARDHKGGRADEVQHHPLNAQDLMLGIGDLLESFPPPAETVVFQVNINRPARTAVRRSTLAIKADAARLLFKVRCSPLTWAVIDSGIDARHPAFWDWQGDALEGTDRKALRNRLKEIRADDDFDAGVEHALWPEVTRVRATYDFTRARDLFDPYKLQNKSRWPSFVKKVIDEADPKDRDELEKMVRSLARRLDAGRSVDWGLAEPFLQVPHKAGVYEEPTTEHGTHVAGILAADWPHEEMQGVCPDIQLYDMRVLKPGARNDEFAVLAALQFINYLNDQKDLFRVHGVNMSLAIRHDVANFACGRTPICDECERVIGAGVVVVAAAGNEGYLQYVTSSTMGKPRTTEGYHTVSITDPGNAARVITVGSTHRFQPHTYGVSYFSSRGPTGDGRIKPDLVAPGEKVEAPIPNGDLRTKDGTSMAAPHVSGAAAMLMARHSELIGQPETIKAVLCDTATDLGRERYFQGAGMLDVLRAIQSV